jgi:hypothetical protein
LSRRQKIGGVEKVSVDFPAGEMAGPIADAGDMGAPGSSRAFAADDVAALKLGGRAAARAVIAKD